jgi:site-specific recombinase XerD
MLLGPHNPSVPHHKALPGRGVRGGSSHAGRRTFASNLIEQGHDIETVQQPLGHAELGHVRPYLAVSDKKLRQMFCEVL